MRRRAVALGALLVAAAFAPTLPSAADHSGQPDPNDTGGRLDVMAVDLVHDAGPPRWVISTFGRWTARWLWDRGYLIVELDTRGKAEVDHLAVVRSDGRELVATLFRVRLDGRQVAVAPLASQKVGPGAAAVAVPLRKLSIGPNRTSYFWSVKASFTSAACPRTCIDRVPDEGMVEQPLPGVTPTPTPSPTTPG